jgi:hypothetical protein
LELAHLSGDLQPDILDRGGNGIGVLATERVNLGVESFIRTQQGTVVAAWNRVAEAATMPAMAQPAAAISAARPAATISAARPAATSTPAQPAATISSARPAATSSLPGPTRTPALAGQPTTAAVMQTAPSQAAAPKPTIGNTNLAASPITPSPQAIVMARTDPILVSNPDATSIARIHAEMGNSAVGRPVQIRYDEAALNREVTALLSSYPDLPYQNLHIDLERNQVILKGNMTIMGLPVNAEVDGVVVARDCRPQVEIGRISIAGLMTPGFVRDSISNLIAESLSWYPPDYPLCLEQIVIEQDRVTIYGSRR